MSRSLLLIVFLGIAGCGASQIPPTLGQIQADAGASNSEPQNRKVIVEATVHLAVASLMSLENDIPRLTKEYEGYLAEASIDRTQGMHLTGRWIARVPVAHFEAFIKVVSELGVVEKFDQQTQDVTEEFIDLKTRIENEKQLESRIVDLLKKTPEEIKEVIEVERELARVRGEIEKMEGRLKFLANRTEFTTVTIIALERQKYVPPRAPTLANQISDAWWTSLRMLRECATAAVITFVFLVPWLVITPLIILAVRWALRRRHASAIIAKS